MSDLPTSSQVFSGSKTVMNLCNQNYTLQRDLSLIKSGNRICLWCKQNIQIVIRYSVNVATLQWSVPFWVFRQHFSFFFFNRVYSTRYFFLWSRPQVQSQSVCLPHNSWVIIWNRYKI